MSALRDGHRAIPANVVVHWTIKGNFKESLIELQSTYLDADRIKQLKTSLKKSL
jgi:hypothetical protein